ncbi:cupin domain-containing protein [Bacillus benzoevorans]|uniref:Quercetin dioxygenase-like cupin family protein n=1 Tax=Bacillus benzoevorans TaxID=1456 RepID=A0A7X0HNP3_9BACI|nr:cupin domain-containing protein [Bacillus benzoevorans]MBB6444157.1 quercetin dioxygenase-like cupin family protein [Bacillus benzoevorans]
MEQTNLQKFIEYSEEKFTKRVIFKEGDSAVFVLNFAPQQALPAHKHPGANVYLLVVAGSGTFTIDKKEIKVQKNDVVLCTAEEEMAFLNDGQENTSLYVLLNKIPDERYAQNI